MDFIFSPLIYCQNQALLKDGLVQHVSPLYRRLDGNGPYGNAAAVAI